MENAGDKCNNSNNISIAPEYIVGHIRLNKEAKKYSSVKEWKDWRLPMFH
jgi:hypothetical protein